MKALILLLSLLIMMSFVQTASIPILQQTAPCIDQQNDVLLPVFGECSQFYGCKNGKAILRNCLDGLYFDPETKNCTEASKSNCVQEQPISVKSEKPTETPQIPKYICLGKAIGSLVPSRTNCSEYYTCISSTPTLRTCGGQLHFNSFSQSCISSTLSNCAVKARTRVTTTRKPELIQFVCKGKFDGEKFPVPGNCSKYFDCLGHKAYEKSCGQKHFYPVSRTCIDPEVSECFEGNVRVKPVPTEPNEIGDVLINGKNDVGDMNIDKNKNIDQLKEIKDVNGTSSSQNFATNMP